MGVLLHKLIWRLTKEVCRVNMCGGGEGVLLLISATLTYHQKLKSTPTGVLQLTVVANSTLQVVLQLCCS